MRMETRIQLSVMMFIEFFIWGAWFVTMGNYLTKIGFSDPNIGLAYTATAWAAIISPFFVGMVADRFFSAEKVLGVIHLIGAGLMFWAATITDPKMFFLVVLGYAVCYMPTLALTNTIAFNQMTNPEKEFPPIRVLGTLGWIVAGLVLMVLGRTALPNVEATAFPLKMAAGASVLMGLYSFALPHTPPKGAGQKITVGEIIGLDALKLMKSLSFTVFVIGSLLVCVPLSFYYAFGNVFLNESGMTDVVGKMTMGQMSEVFFMLVMPFFLIRLGVKKMLLLGMLAWVARYFLFAYGNAGDLVFMLYGGILLHGVCYDFFFVTGQIYVNNEAPESIRASAQGFLSMITYGVGMVIGGIVAGRIAGYYKVVDEAGKVGHIWKNVWLAPALMAAVVMVLFLIFFKDKPKTVQAAE